MEKQGGPRRPIVPFERFCAVVGYAICSLVVIVVLLDFGSWVVLSIRSAPQRNRVPPSMNPAYAGEPWASEFWKEQTSMWKKARYKYVPFVIWGAREWHGKYLNTDDTEMGTWRRTVQAMSTGCPRTAVRNVWVFGGSTVYGTSDPDSGTIPSYLSEELNRDPRSCIEVTNLGAEAYVTNQEVILLIEQLKAGRRPDVGIFCDGINEALVGGFSPGIPSAHWEVEEIRSRFENTIVSRLSFLKRSSLWTLAELLLPRVGRRATPTLSDSEVAARAQAVLDNYEENLRLVRVLAAAYGFKAYFFWQPELAYGNKPTGSFERDLKNAGDPDEGGQLLQRITKAVYKEAEHRSEASESFIFLGHVLDGVSQPLYSDGMHLAPRGNKIIAQTIAQEIGLTTPARGANSLPPTGRGGKWSVDTAGAGQWVCPCAVRNGVGSRRNGFGTKGQQF